VEIAMVTHKPAGEIIKEYRLVKGLTRKQLASSSKLPDGRSLTYQAIYYIETGQRSPTEDTIRSIAKALGIPAAILFS